MKAFTLQANYVTVSTNSRKRRWRLCDRIC